jgi:hypothetical protein
MEKGGGEKCCHLPQERSFFHFTYGARMKIEQIISGAGNIDRGAQVEAKRDFAVSERTMIDNNSLKKVIGTQIKIGLNASNNFIQ